MENRLFAEQYFIEYRNKADAIFFDIAKEDWNPSFQELDGFCRQLYSDVVDKYKKLERTQEYAMTGEVLVATGSSRQSLAFLVGGGLTENEICATHAISWELQRLLNSQKTESGPIDFRFLAVGYKEKSTDALPSRELYEQLGIANDPVH